MGRVGTWLARLVGAVPPHEMDGIRLEGPYREVSGHGLDPARFLRALAAFVPAGSTLMLEGGDHDDETRALLAKSSIPPPVIVARGTIWPRAQVFHLPATDATLEALAELMEHRVPAQLCWHLHVYDAQGVVLEWHDAFDNLMGISKRVPVESVEALCAALKTYWKDGEPVAR